MVSFPWMGNSGEFLQDEKFWMSFSKVRNSGWVSPRWEILVSFSQMRNSGEFFPDEKFWWLSEESQQQPRCVACPDEFRTSVDDLFIFVHPGFLISACIPVDNCTSVFVCLLCGCVCGGGGVWEGGGGSRPWTGTVWVLKLKDEKISAWTGVQTCTTACHPESVVSTARSAGFHSTVYTHF